MLSDWETRSYFHILLPSSVLMYSPSVPSVGFFFSALSVEFIFYTRTHVAKYADRFDVYTFDVV